MEVDFDTLAELEAFWSSIPQQDHKAWSERARVGFIPWAEHLFLLSVYAIPGHAARMFARVSCAQQVIDCQDSFQKVCCDVTTIPHVPRGPHASLFLM